MSAPVFRVEIPAPWGIVVHQPFWSLEAALAFAKEETDENLKGVEIYRVETVVVKVWPEEGGD